MTKSVRGAEIVECPLCCGESHVWLQRGSRDLRRCAICRFLWVPQGVVSEDGVTIYQQDPPIFLSEGNTDYYLDESNRWNAEEKVAWLREIIPLGGSLLDVGANFGHFMAVAGSFWEVRGLEPSTVAVRWAKEEFGLRLDVGSIYDQRPEFHGRFDVVTMWDVIEHLSDPARACAAVRRFLKPDGMLYMTTPDAGSPIARAMGRHWHYLDLVQHVSVFNKENVTRLLERAGFRVCVFKTFGRVYRTSYVRERMRYLARTSLLWRVLGAFSRPSLTLASKRLTINLGDVMGIAARIA